MPASFHSFFPVFLRLCDGILSFALFSLQPGALGTLQWIKEHSVHPVARGHLRGPRGALPGCLFERLHSVRCAVRHLLLSATLSVSHDRAHSFQKTKVRVRNTRGCSQEFTEQADRIRLSARLPESRAGQTHSLSSKCYSVPSLRPSRDSAG